jgi:pantoate kinase
MFCIEGKMVNTIRKNPASEVLFQISQSVLSGLGLLHTIKKLMGRNNYSNWKFSAEMFLVPENLWDLVTHNKTHIKKDAKAKSKICIMVDKTL